MKYITTRLNKYKYDYDYKLDKSDEINTPTYYKTIEHDFISDVFIDKYGLLVSTNQKVNESDDINKFIKYKNNLSKDILLYKNLSVQFVADYVQIYDMKEFFLDKKNILLFNWGINISEALLYLYTYHNIINKINMYIYHIFCLPVSSSITDPVNTLLVFFNKLKQNYEGEKLYINSDHPNEIITIDYQKIIDRYRDKKLDLINFDYRFGANQPQYQLLHLTCTYIMFNLLEVGGVYMFIDYYSNNYLKNILTILSKYFQKIIHYQDNIRVFRKYFFICVGFVGYDKISREDKKIFEDILDKNKNKQCSYSDLYIKSMINPVDEKISNAIDQIEKSKQKYVDKLLELKKNYQYLGKLSYQELVDYYNSNLEINYKRHLELVKKYKLKLSPNFYTIAPSMKNKLDSKLYVFENPKLYTVNLIIDTEKKNDQDSNYLLKLLNLKYKLTSYKIGIDTRNAKKWENLTFNLNITNGLTYYYKNKNQKLSRAFFKMIEILHTLNIDDIHDSFHICEAPGHFINATYYYAQTKNIKLNWYANSLNPNNLVNLSKYGPVFSDTYGFIKKNPDRWLWGEDNTGDITNMINIKYFKKKFNTSLNFLTSDCGLGSDDRSDYHNQEEKLSKTNLCQIYIALLTLKISGTAVFKTYMPVSLPISLSIIYLLYDHFDQLSFFKPTMSSPSNNEIYLIAKNKKKNLTKDLNKKIKNIITNFDVNQMIYDYIHPDFIDVLYVIINDLINHQIDHLKVIYYFYESPDNYYESKKKDINIMKKRYTDMWISFFNFKFDSKYLL
jgi:23S rRNA U2552 (ribose-2'-O)-methylase RlmE/FtsJ